MDTEISSVSRLLRCTGCDGWASGSVEASTPIPGRNGPTTGTAFSSPGNMGMDISIGTMRQPPDMLIPM